MTKPLLIIDPGSTLSKTLQRLTDEAQPVKLLAELAIVNNIRRILGLPLYTVESWNAKHFPSSSLH